MTGLRAATASDATACGTIMQNWLDETPWIPDLHTVDGTIRFIGRVLIGEYTTTVAGDPVHGFISVEPDNSVAALYISKNSRGQGIGSALLNHAKSQADHLSLWVFQSNIDAIRFYIRHGFTEVRRTVGDNEEKLPDILMEWHS